MGIIHEKLQDLRSNYSTLEILKFDEFLGTCESTTIIEDFQSVIVEPTKGASFAKEFMLNTTLGEADLNSIKKTLEDFLSNAREQGYDNYEHITILEEILDIANAKLNYAQESTIAELLIDSLYMQELKPTTESAKVDKNTLKLIGSKDLDDKRKVELSKNFTISINKFNGPASLTDINNISEVSKIIIRSVVSNISPEAVMNLVPTPIVVANKLVENGVDKATVKAYIRAFKTENNKVKAIIDINKSNQMIDLYQENLEKAIKILETSEKSISLESCLESAITTQGLGHRVHALDINILENFYNFVFSENESVEESIQWFNNIIGLSNVKHAVVLEAVSLQDPFDDMDEFEHMIDMLDDDSEDDLFMQELEELDDDIEDEFLTEGSNADKARRKVNVTAHKIKSNVQKLKTKSKQKGQPVKAMVNHVNNAGKAIDDAATNAVNKAKGVYRNDVRGEIIESKTTVKLGRIIRKGIMIGSLTLVNPALGAIGAMTTLALRKNVKAKERRKILQELQEELEIVNEKIEDSRGDENKEKKYQLMRIRNKLQRDITRIQYGLKADDKGV